MSTQQLRKCIGCLYSWFVLIHEATNPETVLARGQMTTLNWHLANYGKILWSNSGKRENCKTHKSQVLLALSSLNTLQSLGQCSPNHRLTPNFLSSHITSVSFSSFPWPEEQCHEAHRGGKQRSPECTAQGWTHPDGHSPAWQLPPRGANTTRELSMRRQDLNLTVCRGQPVKLLLISSCQVWGKTNWKFVLAKKKKKIKKPIM